MPERMLVHVVVGIPGAGKSTRMLLDAAQNKGRYLFAVPTIDLLEEQAERLDEMAPSATIVRVHSRSATRGSVKRQISDLTTCTGPHVIALITHEALLDADFSGFSGWHARIDEPPHGFHRGQISIEESLPYFENKFDLDPVGSGSPWAQLKPKGSIRWPEVQKDTLTKDLVDFRKLAARPQGVFVDLLSWQEAKGRLVTWFSLWTPLQVRSFASVLIAGAGYLTSLAYRACRDIFGGDVDFEVSDLGEPRTGQPTIIIHYFTEAHEGSTTFWESDRGRSCLVSICKWFERSEAFVGYWSGNDIVRLLFHDRIEGERANPKVAGLNSYRQHESCLFIYSSKAHPDDVNLHDLVTISKDDVRRAREDEDILQFAWRGAIRSPDFDGRYDIYLYSRDQAERLGDALRASGFDGVMLQGVPDAGIMAIMRPMHRKRGMARSPADELARLQRRRDQGRERARRHRDKRNKERASKSAEP